MACVSRNVKIYYWTSTASSNVTNATNDTTDSTEFVVSDKSGGWQEISSEAIVYIEEPAQEQDEPDTGERPVYWERPHRRLATVTVTRDRPRQLESTFG